MIKKLFNRETSMYAVFGVLTSIENVVLFRILLAFGIEYRIANLITLIVVKLTAYVCNKNFVFKSHCESIWALLAELGRFVFWRGATALIDYFGLILLVELLHMPKLPGKIIVTVLVIVINYITGKKQVFKSTEAYGGQSV